MAILNASQITAIEQYNEQELNKGTKGKFGYPGSTIRDLLQTIRAINKEKKKWQRLAQDRGETITKITELGTLSMNRTEPESD